ncbi:MAG: neutral zinc metallopeptidase [Gordonia sp. (in: high G+C Gram-positive bacteria)]|uniref:KPN_02809 family neutral zinc metallopeptidase n=1 Tax=Gordonia sp. (in: high G+C Gram-positive bacteria) TaxID=84139 RepID=UPI003BB4E825
MTFQGSGGIDGGGVGAGGGGGGGGRIAMGGGLGLVVTLIALFFGLDLTGGSGSSSLTQDQGASQSQLEQHIRACTYEQANAGDSVCIIAATADSLNAIWPQLLNGYTKPQTRIFSGSIDTACGHATSAMGPFYCPADQTAYFDPTFFAELKRMGGSDGNLAQMYVVAHEFGHHVENLMGVLAKGQRMGNDGSVRIELQADCLAGVWAHHAQEGTGTGYLKPITDEQIATVIQTARAIGDDTIQGARSNPEGWTHGSADQRVRWFQVGYDSGELRRCDTFATNQL